MTAMQIFKKAKLQEKLDKASLKRCIPCKKCGTSPKWGSGFLYCPNPTCGGFESNLNIPSGRAVRHWNKENKKG